MSYFTSNGIENASFDSNLFGFKVGRIELEDQDVEKISLQSTILFDDLKTASDVENYKLIYLMSPSYNPQGQTLLKDLETSLFGINVDYKLTYRAPLEFFSKHHLRGQSPFRKDSSRSNSFDVTNNGDGNGNGSGSAIEIIPHPFDASLTAQPLSSELRDLAIASGEYSRFKVDKKVPNIVYEELFTCWIQNSINRTLAHETFIAIDTSTSTSKKDMNDNSKPKPIIVGMITVKQKGDALIDIGLVAVSPLYRRQGIATMLLSKAVLWALDRIGHLQDTHNPIIQVVTQKLNKIACKTYEKYGFTISSVQLVNHVWLPDDIVNIKMYTPVKDIASIPYCKQYLTGNEIKYINEIMESCLLDSCSKYTTLCSNKLKQILTVVDEQEHEYEATAAISTSTSATSTYSCERVLITNSGTASLEMAAVLCNIKPDDEIIMPSYTFSSTANAFVLRGGIPVFVDINMETLNINENLIELAITSKTKAICVVHYAGIPCEMDTIMAIANKYNLYVIEDAAQAFLSTYKGKQCGTIGHFGCYSFHYTKNIICGEGGALSVNCGEDMVRKALIMWEKGTNRCDFMSGKIDKYEWVDIGSSHVPSEISCAILYAQLEQCYDITYKRVNNFNSYYNSLQSKSKTKSTTSLSSSSGEILSEIDNDANEKILPQQQQQQQQQQLQLHLPKIPNHSKSNGHIFYIILSSKKLRNIFQMKMKLLDVAVYSHYVPLHSSPAGIKYGKIGKGSEKMIITNYIFNGLLRLPVWVGLTNDDLKKVVDAIHIVLAEMEADIDNSTETEIELETNIEGNKA